MKRKNRVPFVGYKMGRIGLSMAALLLLAAPTISAQVLLSGVPSTSSVTFPATAVGSSSPTQIVQLVTNAQETISSIQVPASMGGKQEFTVGTITGCTVDGTTQNPEGAVCNVPIIFSPAYPGPRNLPLQVITSVGKNNFGLSGTGNGPLAVLAPGSATVLQFHLGGLGMTRGVAVDGEGNAYIADPDTNVISRIDATTGAISTIAGTGTPDFNGDGIPATQAYLYNPTGVATDSAGDIFIADTNNNKIREVLASTGRITTLAGANNGDFQKSGFSGDGGSAFYSLISFPGGLSLDGAGNLYFADTGNQRIRRIDATTGNISTAAGSGATAVGGFSGDGGPATLALLSSPGGVVVDTSGNLYIADTGNNRIRRVDAVTGVITTIAGDGVPAFAGDGLLATSAELNAPKSVALDAAGNLYVTDESNARLRKIEANTGKIFTVAGNGMIPDGFTNLVGQTNRSTSFAIGAVTGVAVDPTGALYFTESDVFNEPIFKVSPNLAVLPFLTTTLVNSADTADDPQSLLLSNDGNIPLNLSVPASGSNPSVSVGWQIDSSSPCQPVLSAGPIQTVASGASCIYALDFQPTTTGALTGTVTLADGSLNTTSTQTANLSGTSAPASATTTLLSFTFVPNYPPGLSLTGLNYDSIDTLAATVGHAPAGITGPINGTVTFYDNGNIMPGGTNLPLVSNTTSFTFNHLLTVGTHAFTAVFTPASGSSLDASTASPLNETVSKGIPVFSFSADNHVYDGNPHGVTVTTVPANLPFTQTYELYTPPFTATTNAPTLPGYYQFSILFNTADYQIGSGTFISIYNLPATVALGNLQAAYDGNPHAATATTNPAGLTVALTYNGSATVPTAVGRYSVIGKIVDPIYAGTSYGTLEIYSTGAATTTWIVNQDSTVSHLSATGAVLTTAGTSSGSSTSGAIAIDNTGNAWSVTNANNSILEVSPAGSVIGKYSASAISSPVSLAIDGAGQIWVANTGNTITVLSNSGSVVSPTAGYLAATPHDASSLTIPSSLAIDSAGSVWITNTSSSTITRIFGAAAPVVTPTVLGTTSATQGTRP